MNDQTLNALKASIKRWEKNAKIRKLKNARISVRSCPLCMLFFKKSCHGCPVSNSTSQPFCDETPYHDAALYEAANDLNSFKFSALEEVAFLKSLLLNEAKP